MWVKEDWAKKAKIARENHKIPKNGEMRKHRGGSISFRLHELKMIDKRNGDLPIPLQLFERTHKGKKAEYVDEKSQHVMKKYDAYVEEKYGPNREGYNGFDMDAWNAATSQTKDGHMG